MIACLAVAALASEADPPDPDTIAVLLPLSGEWATTGLAVRDALQFGFRRQGGTEATRLVYEDTLGTAEGAVAAMDRAVTVEHAIACVGAVTLAESGATLAEAERLHVPLLSLSVAVPDAAVPFWSVSAMFGRADVVDALVPYAMDHLRLRSFAIVASEDPTQDPVIDRFEAAVAARGGQTTQVVRGGMPLGAAMDATSPPVEGILVLDSGDRLPRICAALDLWVTAVRRRGLPAPTILGGPAFDGLSGEGPCAVHDVYAVSRSARVGDADPFVVGYRAATGRVPNSYEAGVVDVGALLAVAVRGSSATRTQFRDALLAARVDGIGGFDPTTHRLHRSALILTGTGTGARLLTGPE